jgi:hypothetical protein
LAHGRVAVELEMSPCGRGAGLGDRGVAARNRAVRQLVAHDEFRPAFGRLKRLFPPSMLAAFEA